MLSFSLVFISFSVSFSLWRFLLTLALTTMMPARLAYVTRRGTWTNWQTGEGGKRNIDLEQEIQYPFKTPRKKQKLGIFSL